MWLNRGNIREKPCDDRSPIENLSTASWTPKQKSRGLGDVIAKVTSALGIKSCSSCKKRQDALNKLMPFAPNFEKAILSNMEERKVLLAQNSFHELDERSKPVPISVKEKRLEICRQCPLMQGNICTECDKDIISKTEPNKSVCPVGKWFDTGVFNRPLVNPKRILMFHLFPKKGADWNWVWHIDQIKKYAHLFHKIIIGVCVGKVTEEIDVVKNLLKDLDITWIVKENTQLAETLTYVEMMEAAETDDPNTIIFRYHTKGVTKRKDSVEQKWAQLLWETNMDIASVEQALSSHLVCGSMRSLKPLVQEKEGSFFFAGSAYWMRAKEAFERDWRYTDQTRWWVEYVPGHLFDLKESACLSYDMVESSVIRPFHFEKHIQPEWDKWKIARQSM